VRSSSYLGLPGGCAQHVTVILKSAVAGSPGLSVLKPLALPAMVNVSPLRLAVAPPPRRPGVHAGETAQVFDMDRRRGNRVGALVDDGRGPGKITTDVDRPVPPELPHLTT